VNKGANVDQEQNNRVGSGEAGPVTADAPVLNGLERIALQDKVIEALRTCYDPEIPVNIHELGLIYEVNVESSGEVNIRMTLTTPNCPAAASLPLEVEGKVKVLPQVTAVKLEIVWEPPWDPSKMTEAARLQLGMF
jgi:FeS assembly SUF system protein